MIPKPAAKHDTSIKCVVLSINETKAFMKPKGEGGKAKPTKPIKRNQNNLMCSVHVRLASLPAAVCACAGVVEKVYVSALATNDGLRSGMSSEQSGSVHA